MKSCLAALLLIAMTSAAAAEQTYRMHDGITAFVVNQDGKPFQLSLDVRDWNTYESGPREVLVKVYDPEGRTVIREVIPDDGITSGSYQHPAGAWDHEAWYYAWNRMEGGAPMVRWSSFSEPARLANLAKRTFDYQIPGGKPGVYRVMLVGSTDHFVTMRIDPELKYGVSGHATYLYGHDDLLTRSYVYVPRGTVGLHVVTAEWDQPITRAFKLTTPDGQVLFETDGSQSYTQSKVDFESPGKYDDQILVLDVSQVDHQPSDRRRGGAQRDHDFLIEIKHRFAKDPEVKQRGERAFAAVFAPDEATAKAIQGGAFYHENRVFWHGYQVRLHDWLNGLKPEDFVVKNAEGNEVQVEELPKREGFVPLNAVYWKPPLCDVIMHHWPAHKNRAALNVALKDLIAGLRSIGPNDHVAVAVGSPFANMGYEFSNYAWHYWRPGWRVLQESDAPDDVKDMVREAFLVAGDRLAFCRSWARVNGNSFAQIPPALRYCSAGTQDPLQLELFETYFDRFRNGGWGERVGVGPSGPIQEGFAYAYHYASYPTQTYLAVIEDFQDERFIKVRNDLMTWFSYTLADERVPAGPWSARTSFYPHTQIQEDGPFQWKGFAGPDLTVSVNDADEWFAARRKNYYAVVYHGRLSPKWNSNANAGNCGYGGGMLCQLQVPGHGLVLASTLNGEYGKDMHTSLWPNFHLHTLVGTCADGRPLVSGDSEHFDANLKDNQVTGSGDVRGTSVQVIRSTKFEDGAIECQVRLDEARTLPVLNLWTQNALHGKVASAHEMIPFVPNQKQDRKAPTKVTLLGADGKEIGELAEAAVEASAVVIDRGGFGVRIELPQPRLVHRGKNHTVMIEVVRDVTPAKEVGLTYRLVPFVSEAAAE